jgi:hypothetical protein
MPENTRTDEQLVEEFLGGDKQAMEILLTRYLREFGRRHI